MDKIITRFSFENLVVSFMELSKFLQSLALAKAMVKSSPIVWARSLNDSQFRN